MARKAVLTLSDDPLLRIPASVYVPRLTGRSVNDGWAVCPWHRGGCERTPSLKADGPMWACFGCEPWGGKRVAGGNIVDFAARLWGYALPVGGIDLLEVIGRLRSTLGPGLR